MGKDRIETIDVLSRDEDVDRLMTVIESFSEKKTNTSFAINGVWGSGKSFVLNILEETLSMIQSESTASDRYLVFYYDSWKYDYYEEPILAIVASMLDTLDKKVNILTEKQKEYLKAAFKSLIEIGNSFLNIANTVVQAGTGNAIKETHCFFKGIPDTAKKAIAKNHEFDSYFNFNKTLERLRNTIKKLSENYSIVIIVDELDRCLPSYAIKVLERLHHITTDLPNTISIIATDKERLGSIIESTIGVKDIDAYLKKFIKFEVELSTGDINDNIEQKFPTYFSLFEGGDKKEAFDFLNGFFRSMDIRSVSQIIDHAELVHTLKTDEKMDYSVMCMEILILILVSHNYDFHKENNYEEVHHDNFLLTRRDDWVVASPMKEYLSTKVNSDRWSRVQTVTGSWRSELTVNSNSSLYDKLCYYYSVIIGSKSVVCSDRATIFEGEPQLVKNSNFISEFMSFVALIN